MPDRVVKVTLSAVTSNFVAGMDAAKKKTQDATASLQKQQEAMRSVGVAATAMGVAAAAGLAYVIKTTADFDAKMSQVQALSHATATDMGKLRDAALDAGQGIGFSASEVADAETELIKAGVSVQNILGGALPGALQLAAAGQIDVGQATEIATIALTQFKLQGKDIPHVADLLAAGADKALGGVADLGEALKSSGLVASQFGVSLEETVGTLSAFANAGLIGETAGTDLRQMLLKLADPSQQASDIMKQLGISLYDASGHFVGIANLAGQLHDKMGALSEAQRNQALSTIFGARAIAGANVLYKEGAAGIADWTKKVNDNGFAAQQASGKMDNLKGDLSKLGAAFQSNVIRAGESSMGVLRDLTKNLTTVTKMFGNLPQPIQQGTIAIVAITAAVGLAGGAFLLGVPKVVAFGAALDTLSQSKIPGVALAAGGLSRGLGAVASFLTGPWGIAVGLGATILGTAFVQNTLEAQQKVDDFTATLDKNTGAFTENTKASTANALQKSGAITAAKRLGIDPEDLTNAALGDKSAQSRVDAATKAATKQYARNAKPGDVGQQISDVAKVNKAIGEQNQTVRDSVKANTEAAQAAGVLTDAQKGLDKATKEASASIADHGKTLDQNTADGRANQAALDQVADAQQAVIDATEKQTSNQDAVTKAWETGRQELYAVAAQMGLTGAAADDYVNNHLGRVPPVVSTNIALTGADQAKAWLDGIVQAQANIQRSITIDLHYNKDPLHWATTPGGGLVPYVNGGILEHAYANGGFENHVAQISPPITRVWAEPETEGEAYIPLAASKRERSLSIWASVGKRFGVQGFADGGVTYVTAPPVVAGSAPVTVAPVVSLEGATLVGTMDGTPFRMQIQQQIAAAGQARKTAISTGLQAGAR